MDWRAWYRAEAESEGGRVAILSAVARFPDGDEDVRGALRRRGAVSFPHTTLRDSAEPLARVATSLLAEGFRQVVALGVLHGSTLAEPERSLVPAATRGDAEALHRVGGAWTADGDARTPFGPVPAGPVPPRGPWTRPGNRLLDGEFSLDLFLAVLSAAAAARRAAPPAVTRVFLGPVTHEEGRSPVAEEVARALRPLLGPAAALVATGDLVHAGHGYAPPEEVASLPADSHGLRAYFEPRVRDLVEGSLARGPSPEAADAAGVALRSDQRHVLPVLAALVGPGARGRVLSFRLTDYAEILGRPSPCVVASVLWALERAGLRRQDAGSP